MAIRRGGSRRSRSRSRGWRARTGTRSCPTRRCGATAWSSSSRTGLLAETPLRIAERVLHALLGLDGLDERLAARVVPLSARTGTVPSHGEIVDRAVAAWAGDAPWPCIALLGDDAAGKDAVAAADRGTAGPARVPHRRRGAARRRAGARGVRAAVGARCGARAVAARGRRRATTPTPRAATRSRAWRNAARRAHRVRDRSAAPARPHRALGRRRAAARAPSSARCGASAWASAAQRSTAGSTASAAQFHLDAAVDRRDRRRDRPARPTASARRCGPQRAARARPRLDDLAQRVVPRATFDELVLPRAADGAAARDRRARARARDASTTTGASRATTAGWASRRCSTGRAARARRSPPK